MIRWSLMGALAVACGSPTTADGGSRDAPDTADAGTDSGDELPPDAGADAGSDASVASPCASPLVEWDLGSGSWSRSFGWRGVANPGIDGGGYIEAAVWSEGELFIGGRFSFAGPLPTSNVAAWSPGGGWRALGGGLPDRVTALIAWGGAVFAATTGDSGFAVHRFSDGVWSSIGAASSVVTALAIDAGGTLLAAGDALYEIGGVRIPELASWTPAAGWSPVAHPLGHVTTVYADAMGICIGGWQGTAPFAACSDDLRAAFRSHAFDVATGFGYRVDAMTRDAAGQPVAAGRLQLRGDLATGTSVAALVGDVWTTLPPPLTAGSWQPSVSGLARDADGSIWAVGDFERIGDSGGFDSYAIGVAQYTGGAWRAVGALQESALRPGVRDVAAGGDDVYVVGSFEQIVDRTSLSVRGVARHSRGVWDALDHPGDPAHGPGPVTALASGTGCGTFVASLYETQGDAWTGRLWNLTADDIAATPGRSEDISDAVYAIALGPGGSLFAAGTLDIARGRAHLARLVAGEWQPVGPFAPFIGAVYGLAYDGADSLYVGGDFVSTDDPEVVGLLRFDGRVWSSVGARRNTRITAIAALEDGACIADRSSAGTQVSCWRGGEWTDLGPVTGSDILVLVEWEGSLVAGGMGDDSTPEIAAWNGSTWAPLPPLRSSTGDGFVRTLSVVGGTLVAGGKFDVGPNAAYLIDGEWTALPGGAFDGPVMAIVPTDRGLLIGGYFEMVGDLPSWGLARLEP